MKNELINRFTHRLMKRYSLSLLLLALPGAVVASPIAGIDFSDEFGGNTAAPEDLEVESLLSLGG